MPYVALIASLLLVGSRIRVQRRDIGQRSLAIVLLFRLVADPVLVIDSSGFFSPLVSWLRLVETFSIVWLMPYVITCPSDVRFVMGMVAGACAIELGRALIDAVASGQLSTEYKAATDPIPKGFWPQCSS